MRILWFHFGIQQMQLFIGKSKTLWREVLQENLEKTHNFSKGLRDRSMREKLQPPLSLDLRICGRTQHPKLMCLASLDSFQVDKSNTLVSKISSHRRYGRYGNIFERVVYIVCGAWSQRATAPHTFFIGYMYSFTSWTSTIIYIPRWGNVARSWLNLKMDMIHSRGKRRLNQLS